MIDTAFAHRLGVTAGLRAEVIDELSQTIELIRETLDDDERRDFAVELMDCVRSTNAELLDDVLHEWWLTSQIRRHPDYEWQKKEFDNLRSSGELQMQALDGAGLQPA